ncbi:MAG: diguanylate cyclase [Gammaproteobacteria bacterium]|nr:diguanylate cyclase [Gammaproteobacteria bacterium]
MNKDGELLSWQLLKAVLSSYFVITFLVTLVQVGIEYQYTRDMVKEELQKAERTFYPALSTALWELNTEQLQAIQQGILDLPNISGIHLVTASGEVMPLGEQGNLVNLHETSIRHHFKIAYHFAGEDIFLAEATFFAAEAVVINRLKVGFQMIVISALIKSIVLTLLFIVIFRRRLGKPLRQLTAAVNGIDLDSLHNNRIDFKQPHANELTQLEINFNRMLRRLDEERNAHEADLRMLNKSLEEQVINRTNELVEVNQRLQQLVDTDHLTGAANRRHFTKRLQNDFLRAQRKGQPFSLLMFDLDHFKKINDAWGHSYGDEVLCNFTQTTTSLLRASDLFARLGGEEFVALLPETDLQGASETAERILTAIRAQRIDHPEGEIHYTVSIGIALLQQEDGHYETIMARADAALYRAKRAGRDCWRSG